MSIGMKVNTTKRIYSNRRRCSRLTHAPISNSVSTAISIFAMVIMCFVSASIAAFISGCEQEASEEMQSIETISDVSDELQQMWPIWKPDDLQINKGSGNGVQYKHELNRKPKFYEGTMPLVYTSKQPLVSAMMGMGGTGIYYAHEFSDFSNYFIYDGTLLKGIVAVDKSNTMVAEAKLDWQTDDKSGFYRPKMEEFHYSGGKLVFHCRSEIDYDSGTKISERGQSGSKSKDFFFILPFGINAL